MDLHTIIRCDKNVKKIMKSVPVISDNVNQHLKGKGHAEVYIGYDYKNKKFYNKYDDDGNIIQQSNSEKEKNGIEILGAKANVGNGKRTFGWGQVKYRFPQIMHFKYIDSEKCFKLMQKTDETKYDTRKYVVIWRKN